MTRITTTIDTGFDRMLTVVDYGNDKHLTVNDTNGETEIPTLLREDDATKLASALLGEDAVVITNLPEVKLDDFGWVEADGTARYLRDVTSESVLTNAKGLLAIRAFLVKRDEEKAEAEKAKAEAAAIDARNARRDEVAKEYTALMTYTSDYAGLLPWARAMVDRIIELEKAQPVS